MQERYFCEWVFNNFYCTPSNPPLHWQCALICEHIIVWLKINDTRIIGFYFQNIWIQCWIWRIVSIVKQTNLCSRLKTIGIGLFNDVSINFFPKTKHLPTGPAMSIEVGWYNLFLKKPSSLIDEWTNSIE